MKLWAALLRAENKKVPIFRDIEYFEDEITSHFFIQKRKRAIINTMNNIVAASVPITKATDNISSLELH
jgi:hypothetical protein